MRVAVLVVALAVVLEAALQPILLSVSPRSGGVAGGTVVRVVGEGFVEGGTCAFEDPSLGSEVSQVASTLNSSHLECTMPALAFLQSVDLSRGRLVQLAVTAGQNSRSNHTLFLVYSTRDMQVSATAPSEGLFSVQNAVTIYGHDFVDSGEAVCNVNFTSPSPATFVSSTEVHCDLPALPSPALLPITLSLNGQQATQVPSQGSGALFTFTSTPPTLISAAFTSSYAAIELTFDREVELGGVAAPPTPLPLSCDALFTNTTLNVLGRGAECSWLNSQQRAITVSLTPSSTITNGSLLSLSGDTVRTRHASYSRLATGAAAVTLSSVPLLSVAVIEGPQHVPTCGNITFSGHGSQNSGYRPLLHHWELHSEAASEDLLSSIPEGLTSISMVTLPSSLLLVNTVYQLQLTVQNFLGHQSSANLTFTPTSSPSPLLTVVGGATQAVCAHESFLLQVTTATDDCSSQHLPLAYRWTLVDHTGAELALGSVKNTSILYFPPHSLLHGQTLTATATVYSGDTSSNASIVLTTSEPCLVAHIAGGSYWELGSGEPLVLDGSGSEGVAVAVLSDPLFSVEWTCFTAGRPCLDSRGEELVLLHYITTSLPPHTLPTGTYNITLLLSYGFTNDLVSSTSAIVDIVAESPPMLQVAMATCCGPIPGYDDVTVIATVHSSFPCTVHWSVDSVAGYAEVELSPAVSSSPFLLPVLPLTPPHSECSAVLLVNVTNQIALTFPAGTLLHDNTYRISLQATNERGSLSRAYIDFHTALPPSNGHVTSHPHTGTALLSLFTLTTAGWTGIPGTTPLSYRFGLQSNRSGLVWWLSGRSLVSSLQTILPPSPPAGAEEGEAEVEVVVEVRDGQGAVAMAWLPATMSSTASPQQVGELVEGVRDDVVQGGRWREGMAALSVLLMEIEKNSSVISNSSTARVVAMETLLHIWRNYLPATCSHLHLLLSLLHQASLTPHIPPTTAHLAAHTVLDVVTTLASLGGREERRTEGERMMALTLDTLFTLVMEHSSRTEWRQIQEDSLTSDLLSSLSPLAHSMCQQLSIGEGVAVTVGGGGARVKVARSLLLANYSGSELCDSDGEDGDGEDGDGGDSDGGDGDGGDGGREFAEGSDVEINFGTDLFWEFFHWSCDVDYESTNQMSSSGFTDETLFDATQFCSGLCIITAVLNFDLHWQGNNFTYHALPPILFLSLLHPSTGHQVTPSPSPFTLHFPSLTSTRGQLLCAAWNGSTLEWTTDKCTTVSDGEGGVVCQCDIMGEVEVAVVERCPSGYYGNNCTEVCPQGLWGVECALSCDCSGRGTCSAHDGACDCDPGLRGEHCQEECQENRWGKGCAEECLCQNAASCDHVTGSCDCQSGWTGVLCDEACPDGSYGYYCSGDCQCRSSSECRKTDGVCVCDDGYTGLSCHQPCPEGTFGSGCGSTCVCTSPGTVSCDHITGDCSCLSNWTGRLCEEQILVSPSPSTEGSQSLQVWAVAVPTVVVLIIVALVLTVVIATMIWKKSRKSQVLPLSATCEGEEERSEGSSSEEDKEDHLNMTHAKSLEVLVPRGKKLKEMFPQQQGEDVFQEPPQAHTKLRWQVVQVVEEKERAEEGEGGEGSDSETEVFPSRVSFMLQTDSQELIDGSGDVEEEGGSKRLPKGEDEGEEGVAAKEEQAVMIYYKRGVYLDRDATLKDLRNAFLDSGQLEGDNRLFQFLKSDVPGDTVAMETEEETFLSELEPNLVEPQTVFFQLLEGGSAPVELCICGRYADLECSECKAQGYCSSTCQNHHWPDHAPTCRVLSARRRTRRQRKRRRKRRMVVTPDNDLCPCGEEAKFDCSQCGIQGYCSEECQLEDWPRHQKVCYKQGKSP